MEKYQEVSHKPFRIIFLHNFLGGLAWGLGATVGLSILLAIIGFIFQRIDLVPIAGDFLQKLTLYIEQIEKTSPPFR